MSANFAGDTSRLYAQYRRDLPEDQAAQLTELLGLDSGDVIVDLGCGTGQLAVPIRQHCAAVIGLDPEPGMLTGLREREAPSVLPALGADTDLPTLGPMLGAGGRGAGAVVIGNALHWMDEPAALASAAALLRPGGGIAVITQGPPLWLGSTNWQTSIRAVLEEDLGPVTDTCGSDETALHARAATLRELALDVSIHRWDLAHPVDPDWIVGHLGSALPHGALQLDQSDGLAAKLRRAIADQPAPLTETVTTTALVARLPI